jgi:hypothetical protein
MKARTNIVFIKSFFSKKTKNMHWLNTGKLFSVVLGLAFLSSSASNAYYVAQSSVSSNSFNMGTALTESVKLNEIFANAVESPETNYEWIELYNTSEWAFDINGWKIKDAADNEFVIDSSNVAGGSTLLGTGQWALIYHYGEGSFSLNNGAEVVILSDTNVEIDSFSYASAVSDKSWGRIPDVTGSWFNNLTPTPGGSND